jgi:propanol-preferring alcohol dehydrogenase
MKAMVLERIGELRHNPAPLRFVEMAAPVAGRGELLIKVAVCGVCHTELDEIEGRTPPSQFPIVLGHQVVGTIAAIGDDVHERKVGERVGIAWIHSACGQCDHCRTGNENLCAQFKATGRDVHGGYAEYTTVPEGFAHPLPASFSDAQAAPLLCAGAIGYRSLRLCGLQDGQTLGLTGFGASAHLVLKMVRHRYPHSGVYVFARSPQERSFALELGAIWAGATEERPPVLLDAIIDTTPAWKPVLCALEALNSGGRLVINAIRKEPNDKAILEKLNYADHLWMEKEIKSVANVARQDVREFVELAARIPIQPVVTEFALSEANQALLELKQRRIRGAKVLRLP